jgi:hypothetical protein
VADGRLFTDATEERLRAWLAPLPDIEGVECWTTNDVRPEREGTWLKLSAAMAQAAEIDLAVAFIKTTGLRLLLDDLRAALGRDETRSRPPARLRVLTSDADSDEVGRAFRLMSAT